MRVLRITSYGGIAEPPMTMVVREPDITVPLEEAQQIMDQPPDMFIITEIFEADDSLDLAGAAAEAILRYDTFAHDERNMSVLYWWMTRYFPLMANEGVIGTQRPSPLSADACALVFRALAQRSDYRSFKLLTHTEEGDIVEYRSGQVFINGDEVQATH